MKKPRIFLIDDEESMRISLSQYLSLDDYPVESFAEPKAALKRIDGEFDGVVVSDIRMPGMDGMELLTAVLARDAEIPVVLITAHGDIRMAVTAIRKGAYDFIEKPFDPELLLETVRRAGEKRSLVLENRRLREELACSGAVQSRLLGNSQVMQLVHREIDDLGPTDASVFLVGETGCGKEVVARALHERSERRGGPFVAINCGAIPENLFESELFGHEQGAYTGAQGRHVGKFERANGGTLFLDEVTAMPLNMQVKALRVLQEREVERLGGTSPIPINIRVISASNRDPHKACREGLFREDLYYRLNLAEIHIPPLRERGNDILLLFDYFVLRAAEQYNREVVSPGSESTAVLLAHEWPGNVRELKNTAERFVLSSLPVSERIPYILQRTLPQSTQLPGLAPSALAGAGTASSLSGQLANFERCVIERALRQHQGNIQAVMDELDLPRRTLNLKMHNHGLLRKNYINRQDG